MATSTISNTVTNPSGTALSGVPVIIRLVPRGGFRISDATEITPVVTTTTDTNGLWSVALERNSNVTPANSYYEVEEQCTAAQGGPRKYTFQVGASNQSLYAALISAIPDLTSQSYLTQTSADARYQQLTGYGVAGDLAESRPADAAAAGVLTTAARSDHKHDREQIYGTAAERAALSGTDLFNGLVFTESDTGLQYTRIAGAWVVTDTGGQWVSFTATAKFGATAATITQKCRYYRAGRLIVAKYGLFFTNLNGGTGTFTLSLPVTARTFTAPDPAQAYIEPYGQGHLFDLPAATNTYPLIAFPNDVNNLYFKSYAHPAVLMTHAAPIAISVGASATGDELWASVQYEAAA